MDLRDRVPNIKAIQRQSGIASYDKLFKALAGRGCSVKLAKRIEAATNGEIRAVWLLGLEAPPDLHLPTTTDVVKAS